MNLNYIFLISYLSNKLNTSPNKKNFEILNNKIKTFPQSFLWIGDI